MKKEKLGTEPAFPIAAEAFSTVVRRNQEPIGMSKRFYAACAVTQGMLSNPINDGMSAKRIVECAYQIADELLTQENE